MNAFTDNKNKVKSHIDVNVRQLNNIAGNESKTCLKRRRLIGANDKTHWRRKTRINKICARPCPQSRQ